MDQAAIDAAAAAQVSCGKGGASGRRGVNADPNLKLGVNGGAAVVPAALGKGGAGAGTKKAPVVPPKPRGALNALQIEVVRLAFQVSPPKQQYWTRAQLVSFVTGTSPSMKALKKIAKKASLGEIVGRNSKVEDVIKEIVRQLTQN
jgi:hypothetical protein